MLIQLLENIVGVLSITIAFSLLIWSVLIRQKFSLIKIALNRILSKDTFFLLIDVFYAFLPCQARIETF